MTLRKTAVPPCVGTTAFDRPKIRSSDADRPCARLEHPIHSHNVPVVTLRQDACLFQEPVEAPLTNLRVRVRPRRDGPIVPPHRPVPRKAQRASLCAVATTARL